MAERNPLGARSLLPDDNPLNAGAPTEADAWRFNADWLREQRARSAQMGLLDPQTGLPTQAGWLDAASQYGNALMMGTTAPTARVWYHGTSNRFDTFSTPEVYLTDHPGQAAQYARSVHRPGAKGGEPTVLSLSPKQGKVQNIDDHLFDAMDEGIDLDDAIRQAAADARKAGDVRYLEYTHPNAGDQGEHTVRVSLYPHEDLRPAGASQK